MRKDPIAKNGHHPITHRVTGAVLALAFSGAVTASDWKFTAGVGATGTYTDNVTLGAAGGRSGDFVTSIAPTVSAKKEGARLKVDARYSMQNLFYTEDSARNTVYHQLNANANAELYENEIFLDTNAAISQTYISPLGATGTDNINATDNITSVQTITLSPYWIHRFGSTATLNVRDTISRTSNDTEEYSGSTDNTFSAGLNSGSAFGKVSWGLNFLQQNADFQDRSSVKLTTTSASLGYQVLSRVRVTGTIGNEDNSFETNTGEAPGGFFWNTTVSWVPSTRTSLDFGFGHRFYGNTWNLAFKTRGKYSTWTADYNEGLSTSNSQFAATSAARNPSLQTSPFNQPPPTSLINQDFLSNQVFLSKRFSTSFSWAKGKSDLNLTAFHSTETTLIDQGVSTLTSSGANDIFLASENVKQVGITGAWNWRFSSNLSSNVSFGVTRDSYSDLNRADTTSSLQIGLNRQFSSQLNGSLSVRRQNRDSDQDASDYTENSISGSVNYTF